MTRVAGWEGDGEVREERRHRANTRAGIYLRGLIAYTRARLERAQATAGPWAGMARGDWLDEVALIAGAIEHLERQT